MAWEKIYGEEGRVFEEVDDRVKNFINSFLRWKGCRVIDIGCGNGRHCIYLAKQGYHTAGLDVSVHGLKIAKKWILEEKLIVHLVLGDMAFQPFKDASFDVLICMYTIYHAPIKKIMKSVNESYRILKDNGVGLFTLLSVEDQHYGKGKEIEKNTFLQPERVLGTETQHLQCHHYFNEEETRQVFSEFKIIRLKEYKVLEKNTSRFYWEIIIKTNKRTIKSIFPRFKLKG